MKREAIAVGDVGGSGGRVSVFSRGRDGYALESAHEFSHFAREYHLPVDGTPTRTLYWDLCAINAGLCEGLAGLGKRSDLEIVSLGLDGWGSDGVWISRRGDTLFPSVIAHDARWREAREEVNRIMPGRERFDLTGTYPDDFLVVNQIHWMNTRQPGVVAEAKCFMPLPSLYHYWFCGEAAAEYTWSTTGHLGSVMRRDWTAEVFERLGLPREKMPPFRQTGGELGVCHAGLAERLGLPRFKVLIPPNHDTACAFAGAPVGKDRTAFIVSAGTWWCMGGYLPEALVDSDVFASGFSNVGGVDGAVLNVINMGSLPVQALRREWSREDGGRQMTWEEMNALAAPEFRPDLDFPIDDPRLRTPPDMARMIMELAGLDPAKATRGKLVALVYQGLAHKTTRLVRVLSGLLGKEVEEILVVGGGAANDLMNQWLADVCGLPVRTGSPNATTLGNALVQAVTLGWFKDMAEGLEATKGLWAEKEFPPARR
ncbi:MAG: hypothetical protein LBJ46_08805 [Planctomycetota bacterium]|jgi:sugar (pentulose or hexulose) kinase|nr:hypothetical protein [Planctomycetota bacterium]